MERGSRKDWRTLMDVSATLMMMAASAAVVWIAVYPTARPAPPVGDAQAHPARRPPPESIALGDAPVLGDREAPVVVIEYLDFECPTCAAFSRDVLPTVVERYIRPGQVQLAVRHLPSQSSHPNARKAAEAAECSRRQGRFWEMHEALFSRPPAPDDSKLIKLETVPGIEVRAFRACLAGEANRRIDADIAEARRLGITGTPTFLVGRLRDDARVALGRRRTGALSIERFVALVQEAARWPAPK